MANPSSRKLDLTFCKFYLYSTTTCRVYSEQVYSLIALTKKLHELRHTYVATNKSKSTRTNIQTLPANFNDKMERKKPVKHNLHAQNILNGFAAMYTSWPCSVSDQRDIKMQLNMIDNDKKNTSLCNVAT